MGPRKAWIDLFWLDLKQNNKTRKWSRLSMLLLKVGCMLELFKNFLWLVALPTIHLGSPTNPQIMATWFFHFNWFFLISVPLLHSSVVSQAVSGSVRNGFSFLRLRPREKREKYLQLSGFKMPWQKSVMDRNTQRWLPEMSKTSKDTPKIYRSN